MILDLEPQASENGEESVKEEVFERELQLLRGRQELEESARVAWEAAESLAAKEVRAEELSKKVSELRRAVAQREGAEELRAEAVEANALQQLRCLEES